MQVAVKLRRDRQQLGAVCHHISPAAALADGSPHLAQVRKRAISLGGVRIPVNRLSLMGVDVGKGISFVQAGDEAVTRIVLIIMQRRLAQSGQHVRDSLRLGVVRQQKLVVTDAIRVAEGEDRQHPGLLRQLVRAIIDRAVGTDVVPVLLVDEASGVVGRTKLERSHGYPCERVLEALLHRDPVAREHAVPRPPLIVPRDHAEDDVVACLDVYPRAVCRLRRRQARQLHHPLGGELRLPPAAVLEQCAVEARRVGQRGIPRAGELGVPAAGRARPPVSVPVLWFSELFARAGHALAGALDLLVSEPHALLP